MRDAEEVAGQLCEKFGALFPATRFRIHADNEVAHLNGKGLVYIEWADDPEESEIKKLTQPFAQDADFCLARFETCPHCNTGNRYQNKEGQWDCAYCDG